VVADYEMTEQEKESIYSGGGTLVEEWFDSYDCMNGSKNDTGVV